MRFDSPENLSSGLLYVIGLRRSPVELKNGDTTYDTNVSSLLWFLLGGIESRTLCNQIKQTWQNDLV